MITIRTAYSQEDMESVWRLTHERYVAEGYALPRTDGLLIHYPHLDQSAQTVVWIAEEAGRILGTLSYTEDGPAGLHVDEDFKDVVDCIRAECAAKGQRLGASWRIVTQPECRHTLETVMGLITRYLEHIAEQGVEVTLYTFNPRHIAFYRRMLDMDIVAGPRTGRAVQSAPAILMRGELPRLVARWRHTVARRESARRHAILPALTG